MKKWYLIAGIFALVGIISLSGCAPPVEELPSVEDAMPIDLAQVKTEFDDDPEAAAAKYAGKLVVVSGVVEDTSEMWKVATIIPAGTGEEEPVASAHCRIPDTEALMALQPGQEVTILGTFKEYMIAADRVVVVDCYVVE